jgi:hypothetical protein
MVAARVWPEFAGDSGDIAGDASVTIEKGRIRIRVRGNAAGMTIEPNPLGLV